MKIKIFALLTLLTLVTVFVVPTFAQDNGTSKVTTITVSESDINSSFHVTNPRNRKITDVKVDLQTGQANVSFTYTERGKDPLSIIGVLTPAIKNGRVEWTLTSVSANGKAATQDQINVINSSVGTALRADVREYLRTKYPGKCPATAVSVTDSEISVTYTCSK